MTGGPGLRRLMGRLSVMLARSSDSRGDGEAGFAYKDGYGDSRWFEMGRWSYGRPTVHVYEGDRNRVVIGSFTSIARDCEIMVGANHRTDWITTWPMKEVFGGAGTGATLWSKGDVRIGNDVWLGHGVRILSGVTVGDGAVIAAYSVVTRDVRPYALVAGSPARELRRRFPDHIVEGLLRLRWWDWPDEVLRERWAELCSGDAEGLISRYGS